MLKYILLAYIICMEKGVHQKVVFVLAGFLQWLVDVCLPGLGDTKQEYNTHPGV